MYYTIFGAAFLVFAIIAPDSFINGDAVVYAEQIRSANFAERTTHLGYYLLAYPVTFLPLKLDHALNLLNCGFGAATIATVGLIGETVAKSRHVGLLSSAIAFANLNLIYSALHAEVYAGQTFFLILSVYFWLTRRDVLGGAAAGAVVVVAALLPVWQNYFFGARGLRGPIGHPVVLRLMLLKTGQDGFYGIFALLPFLFAGILATWRWRFAWGVATAGILTAMVGEKYMDVPVQLPTWMLVSVIVAVGVQRASWPTTSLALAFIGAILAVYPFVPVIHADHLPKPWMIALYAIVVVGIGVFRGRLLPVALLANCLLIGHATVKAHHRLSAFNQAARTLKPANWNEMVRRNWIVCGTAYCGKR